MRMQRIRRILLFLCLLCAMMLAVFAVDEIHDNIVAAQWESEGYPDLRSAHHGFFWARMLGTAGLGLFSYGVMITYFPKEEMN